MICPYCGQETEPKLRWHERGDCVAPSPIPEAVCLELDLLGMEELNELPVFASILDRLIESGVSMASSLPEPVLDFYGVGKSTDCYWLRRDINEWMKQWCLV